MLFKFAEYSTAAPPPASQSPLMLMHPGGIMNEGRLCAVASPSRAGLGHVLPAHVCMADCIKHKLLYLIGLNPALITANSQSLRTALLPLCRTSRVKVTYPCFGKQKDEGGGR